VRFTLIGPSRHGFNEHTLAKWQAYLALQQEFDQAIGTSIYQVLPGVVENTFGWAMPTASTLSLR